jgi:transcriptional regulator with XRE-family HTH domain
MKIGDRIKEVRIKLGLKQGEFAKRIEFSQGAFSDFEGNMKPIADKYIKLICLEFGINEDWLRTGNGDMFRKAGAEVFDNEGKPLNYEEGKFINTYRKLSDPNKGVARVQLKALLDGQESAEKKDEKAG